MGTATNNTELSEVTAFLLHEARLLDERQWCEWSALFTEDGDYWIPVTEDQPDPINYVSLMYEEQTSMELRNRRYEHPDIFSQQPESRTVHLVSGITLEQADEVAAEILVRSCFAVHESRGDRLTVYSGVNWHTLIRHEDQFLIKRKKVMLINSDKAMSDILVYL